MKSNLFWGYMLELSDHMWYDEHTAPLGWHLEPEYTEEIKIDVETWDEVVQYVGSHNYNMVLVDLGDGVKYETHPEIAAPNAWDKDFLKKKLDEMRALGLEPIPKLNFSACHDTWMKEYRRMLCTPIYYKVCADLIGEICELFGYPRIFHIGFEEENYKLQSTYEMAVVRGPDLWWHDFHFLVNECEKHGARAWCWTDSRMSDEEFLSRMPKTVIQSPWLYKMFKDYPVDNPTHRRTHFFEFLDKHGYDQIMVGSIYGNVYNMEQNVAHGKKVLTEGGLQGFLAAPWNETTKAHRYTHLDNAYRMYLAHKKYYPEDF